MSRAAGHPQALPAGGLWPVLLDRYQCASTAGALQPIETEQIIVEDGGVAFVVRRISNLARKHAARDERDGNRNARDPFLPYDTDLFVADIPPDHVALLNKYPVIPHHLLLVTRRFEAQETLLTTSDFSALAACMGQIDGLAFYNGGVAAGASQAHKHLQIVPLPLSAGRERVPVEVLLAAAAPAGAPGRVPGLAFAHGFVRLTAPILDDPDAAADRLMTDYRRLCAATGIEGTSEGGALRQSAPYNLLLTREWMLLVPRPRECVEGISMNALGFAGCLFVRDEAQMRVVLDRGPMALLRAVTLPPP